MEAKKQSNEVNSTALAATAWAEFKKHMPLWLVLSVFVAIPSIVINIFVTSITKGDTPEEVQSSIQQFSDGLTPEKLGMFGLIVLAVMVISILTYTVQIVSFLQIAKTKKTLDIQQAFALSRPYFWRVFSMTFLVGLVVAFGFILLIIPGILFALWYSFVAQVAIEEKGGVKEVFAHSKELYLSNKRAVVLTILLILGISILASYAITIVTSLIGALFPPLAIVLTSVASAFVGLYSGFVFTLLYLELKKNLLLVKEVQK